MAMTAFRAHSQAVGLDPRVGQIFESRCAECHGAKIKQEKGRIKGSNQEMLLDGQSSLGRLASAKALYAGKSIDSEIVRRITMPADDDERMPPKGDLLKPEEIALIKQWIDAAPAMVAPETPPITRNAIIEAIHADLEKMNKEERGRFRYLSLHNLRNAGDGDAALKAYRAAVSKAINGISFKPRIAPPVVLGPEGTLLRLEMRNYFNSPVRIWEVLAASYPYHFQPPVPDKVEKDVIDWTGTEVPYLRADWFVFAAAQPPFYMRLLRLPGTPPNAVPRTDFELESLMGIDALTNIRDGHVMRAAFTDSGISKWNRLIERHSLGKSGYYWKSYDFGNDSAVGDLIQNPLGPATTRYPKAFRHDGGEIIWSMPNGLQAYQLTKASGEAIIRGPSGIVADSEGPQGQVVNGISCIRCHASGMRQPKGGAKDISETAQKARGPLNEANQMIFDRLYPAAAEVIDQLAADAARYKKACVQAGLDQDEYFTPEGEPIGRLYARFRHDITIRTLASELDVSSAELQQKFDQYKDANNANLNSFLTRLPRGIKRQNFVADFAFLTSLLRTTQPRMPQDWVVFEEFRETTRMATIMPPQNLQRSVTVTRDTPRTPVMREAPAKTIQWAGAQATREAPWTNSLGMNFVPVPGTKVLFCTWLTRVQDYKAFRVKPEEDDRWNRANYEGVRVSTSPASPVVSVSWDDAHEFCAWLTQKEIRERKIPARAAYRLPTDSEWSWGVGIGGKERDGTPAEKNGGLEGVYPWGADWPPPKGAGNYLDGAAAAKFPKLKGIENYKDGFLVTSPVGAFKANQFGLYDMGGNVWQWCEDWMDADHINRTVRGGSWRAAEQTALLSSARRGILPSTRLNTYGFRIVLDGVVP